MATYSDDFNRADSGANSGFGANWTHYQEGTPTNSGAQVISNVGRITTSFTLRTAMWSGGASSADQFSQATMAAGSADFGEYVAVRKTDGDNFYAGGRLNGTSIRISKYVAGVQTTLNTGTVTVSDGDVIRLEVSGTSLDLKINGVSQLTTTDSDLSSGNPGLRSTNTTDWDNWSGGDLAAAGNANLFVGKFGALLEGKLL